jgi:hypothetical protein
MFHYLLYTSITLLSLGYMVYNPMVQSLNYFQGFQEVLSNAYSAFFIPHEDPTDFQHELLKAFMTDIRRTPCQEPKYDSSDIIKHYQINRHLDSVDLKPFCYSQTYVYDQHKRKVYYPHYLPLQYSSIEHTLLHTGQKLKPEVHRHPTRPLPSSSTSFPDSIYNILLF